MGNWSTERVLGVLATLDETALPDDFLEVRTSEYRLLRYPERLLSPTLPAAQVVWSHASRSLDIVFDEIASEIRGWELDAFHWWVTSTTRPLETEPYLLARGGMLSDSYQILARELRGDIAESVVPDGMSVELVCDERSLRAAISVETEGWGRAISDEQAIGRRLAETLHSLETHAEFQIVAFIDDKPVSTGCCSIAGEVARFYGAVTLPEFRSRGCYQAVLSSRLRQARDLGTTIALTRGRPLTSGRILVKAGFTVHGQENCYCLTIG
jgi:GNAT superfamily N-acetyltransferase